MGGEYNMKKLAKMLCAALLALTLVACGGEKTTEVTTLEVQFVPTNVETADGTSKEFETYLETLLGMDVNVLQQQAITQSLNQ